MLILERDGTLRSQQLPLHAGRTCPDAQRSRTYTCVAHRQAVWAALAAVGLPGVVWLGYALVALWRGLGW